MKKLVCAKDIEALGARGETVCYVDGDTIVTPSARDAAEEQGIVFSEQMPVSGAAGAAVPGAQEIDAGQVYQVLKALMERGLLDDIFKPFESERHGNGLKVVRGGSVKMDVFETGTPGAKAFFQELVNKEESHISAGFLVIDHSEFPWELTYEEIDYVIEGTLTVTIDGKKYTANAGDVLFVPSGSRVIWGSPDKARIFYATYPANWEDLT